MSDFDTKLDEIMTKVAIDSTTATLPERLEIAKEAKQAIKHLIASELGAIVNANTDENGTDSDRVWEVLMEWMGELQGGGDE